MGNFVFNMPWEPTKYGALITIDLSNETVQPVVDYIRINESSAPVIIDEEHVPCNSRFSFLNELIDKEDNSEEYHADIRKFYNQYRKANHLDIIKRMIRHPEQIGYLMKDFIKRRF